ncbi:MAG: hypothetical protein ACRDK7_13325 [Solirubrobacteraceae bacterium]
MGLLDDAIREHMELKRLRGADPGEVARQEHDALGRISHPERESNFANVGEETAELDMRTVLGGQPQDGGGQLGSGREETPESTSETPGQEQLWLDQQRAPRDFDFDG